MNQYHVTFKHKKIDAEMKISVIEKDLDDAMETASRILASMVNPFLWVVYGVILIIE